MMYFDCPRTNKVNLDRMPGRVVGLSSKRQFTVLFLRGSFKLLAYRAFLDKFVDVGFNARPCKVLGDGKVCFGAARMTEVMMVPVD